jgi:hypothetical protein
MRLAAVMTVLLLGCSSELPHPKYTRQPTSALLEVAYPAPPARVEFVPAQPVPGAVWIRGEWSWQGRRWAWKSGTWALAPEGAAYAPWVSVRGIDGRLFYAPGTWRNAANQEIPSPEPIKLARTTKGPVTNAEDETEPTGEDVHPDAGQIDPKTDTR